MTTTAARVRAIVTAHFGDDATDTAHLANDLKADSLDTVELAMQIEEEFGIALEHDALDDVATVGDLIALIERMGAAV